MTAKQGFTNNASSTLLNLLPAADLSLTVAAGEGALFPVLSGGNWFMSSIINTSNDVEVIKVTARAGDVFTIVRAQEGTTALEFPANTPIGGRVTKGTLENFQQRTDIQANTPLFAGIAGGTADALTATLASDLTALANGMRFMVQAASANATTTPTLTLTLGTTSTGAITIVKGSGTALIAGDIPGADYPLDFQYDSSINKWVLMNPANLATKGANTFTADQTLAENAGLVLDAALSADGKYSGIVEAGTSSAALAFGEVCYRVTATGKWALAKADVAATSSLELGMCVLAAAGADAATTMMLFGKVRADALFDTFTVAAPVYISAATAGKTVSTAPTGTTDFVVRKIGFAEDANTVFFRPSNDYVTLV